jgi:hypothetical protein
MVASKRLQICLIIEKLGKLRADQLQITKEVQMEKESEKIVIEDAQLNSSNKKPRLLESEQATKSKVSNNRLADNRLPKLVETNRNKNLIIDDIENL